MAAWLGVMGAAFLASVQLWLSGTSAAQLVFPAMLGVHALIGLGEGLITVGALRFIEQTQPDVLPTTQVEVKDEKAWIAVGVLISVLVVFFAPLASVHPDGLEKVAEQLGFINASRANWFELLPDYSIPFISNEVSSTIAAGLIGVIVIFALVLVIASVLRRKPMVHDEEL
jgi:cobalt/nickel transport system permease protein